MGTGWPEVQSKDNKKEKFVGLGFVQYRRSSTGVKKTETFVPVAREQNSPGWDYLGKMSDMRQHVLWAREEFGREKI